MNGSKRGRSSKLVNRPTDRVRKSAGEAVKLANEQRNATLAQAVQELADALYVLADEVDRKGNGRVRYG